MTRSLILRIVLGAGLIAVSSCSAIRGQSPTATPLPPVPDLSAVSVEGRLEPVRFATLSVTADGSVSEVPAKEGDSVNPGDLIVLLDNTQTRTLEQARVSAAVELGDANQAVRVAQKALDDYPVPQIFVGLTPEQAARTWLKNLDAARAAFEPYIGTSRKALKPNHHIFPSLPRRIWFDTDEYGGMAKEYNKQVDVAWMNYRKAVDWLALESDLESAKARLLQAQTTYDDLQDASLTEATAGARAALAGTEVRAPFAGTLTNLEVKLGEHVASAQSVATLGDLTGWVVKTTDLTEIDVVNVTEGEPVTVTFDAIPGRTFTGRVSTIAQNYAERQGDVVYTATIVLNQRDPAMRWGMTAQVTFAK